MITKHYHFETIDSTNKKAKELAVEGCPHGVLVTADTQTAGVGRRGRNWNSQSGDGIYMSLVLRPKIQTKNVYGLTLAAALAVRRTICRIGQEKGHNWCPQIKWPNDIVLNKKKVCGILTELYLEGVEVSFVIVGIGINVNHREFPDEIADTATSLFLESGQESEKEKLIEEVCRQFENCYQQFLMHEDLSLLRTEYENGLVNINEKVRVLDPTGEYVGIARGITDKGELIVETERETRCVSSGEVSVRGIYGYV